MYALNDKTSVKYTYVLVISVQTHAGSVWRVTWAHPEFGQVIATCSFDRTTAIWEELRKSYLLMLNEGRLFCDIQNSSV